MVENEQNKKVSVIMGIFNCSKYIDESIKSILNQTYKNIELIICDDGSTDNTYEIAKSYEQKYPNKIILIKNKKNMGLNYTLNMCLKKANGEYIARQDGDDISLKDRLEKEVYFLNYNSEFDFVSTNAIVFDENGKWGQTHLKEFPNKNDFLITSPFCHASSMIKKNILDDVGNYSEGKKYVRVEDYNLWFKIYSKGYRGYNMQEALYLWRDDRDAYNRRKFKYRINEVSIKLEGFKDIGIPFYKYIYAFRPILVSLVPYNIYLLIHRKKMTNIKKNIKIIKVAQFVGAMNCGGTETMLMNIYRNLDKSQYKFYFIENVSKSWYDNEIEKLGGEIIRINNLNEIGLFKYINQLLKIFKEQKFDVVHSHVFLHSGIVMLSAKLANIKIRISHSHSDMSNIDSDYKYKLKKFILSFLINMFSTNLLACSEGAGIYLFGKKFKKKGTVIKNPIRINEIKNIIYDNTIFERFEKKYSLKKNQIILGHVGRFAKVKNHEFLLKIASKLKEKNIDFKMFLIGDGELFSTIQKESNKLGLNENIIFTGNLKNVYEYIKLFDIFLFPSFYEGLPLAIIEAQGFSVKCFVSNRVSQEIDLNINLIDFLDINNGVNEWVDKIIKYNKSNKKDYLKSIQALEDNGYNINSTIKKLEKIYNK